MKKNLFFAFLGAMCLNANAETFTDPGTGFIYETINDNEVKLVKLNEKQVQFGDLKDITIGETVEYDGKKYDIVQICQDGANTTRITGKLVILNKKLQKIDKEAFVNAGITEFYIDAPNAVIGESLFNANNGGDQPCEWLYVNVKEIGKSAFNNMTSLKRVVLGKDVKIVGESAFETCEKVTDLISLSTVPPVCGANAFRAFGTSNIGGEPTHYYKSVNPELQHVSNATVMYEPNGQASVRVKYKTEADMQSWELTNQWARTTLGSPLKYGQNETAYYLAEIATKDSEGNYVFVEGGNYTEQINADQNNHSERTLNGEILDEYRMNCKDPEYGGSALKAVISEEVYKTNKVFSLRKDENRPYTCVHVYLTGAYDPETNSYATPSELNEIRGYQDLVKKYINSCENNQGWDKAIWLNKNGDQQDNFVYLAPTDSVMESFAFEFPELFSKVAGTSKAHNELVEDEDGNKMVVNGTDLNWKHYNVPEGYVAYDQIVFVDANGNEVNMPGGYTNYGDNTTAFVAVPTDEKGNPLYSNWKVKTVLVPEGATVDESNPATAEGAKVIESDNIKLAYEPATITTQSLEASMTENTNIGTGKYEHELTWTITGDQAAIDAITEFTITETEMTGGVKGNEKTFNLTPDDVTMSYNEETKTWTFTATVEMDGKKNVGSVKHHFTVEPFYAVYEPTKVIDVNQLFFGDGLGAADEFDNTNEASAGEKTTDSTHAFLGVESVEVAEGGAEAVFTLAGVKVAESTDNLPAGLYLVRKAGVTKKVLVK